MISSLVVSLISSKIIHAADPNRLYITPASSQMNIGTSFTVNIKSYADSDQSSGSVSGALSYPANLLNVLSISTSGSNYGSPSIGQGSGTITFSGVRSPAPSGPAQIFAVTLQATAEGIATVKFSDNSKVNNSATTPSEGKYTIVNPNPPSQPSTKPKASSPSPAPVISTPPAVQSTPAVQETTIPQATPDPTGVVNNVNVNALYSSATISWKVNAPNPSSTFTYGTSASGLNKNEAISKKDDGTFSTKMTGLAPGIRYYFGITATGSTGVSGNYSGNIITRGFPIVITVTENKIAAKGAQVKIGNRNYTTTADGKISVGLASGNYSGTITTETASSPISLTVDTKTIPSDGVAPTSQTFAYNLTSSVLEQGPGSSSTIFSFIGALIVGTMILAVGFAGFMIYRRHKFENETESSNPMSTVIIDDGYDWRSDKSNSPSVNQPENVPEQLSTPSQFSQSTNSVHISEDEPIDMFDRAADLPLPTAHVSPIEPNRNATEQSPNPPHSTMP
ncbi:MAG: hypothetical protein WAW80_02030 [Candidatus Saccharimonadales bacterium]